MKLINLIFTVLFLLIISTPFIFFFTNIQTQKVEIYENRRLAHIPKYINIKQFNHDLELYINDNIPLRTNIISYYHYLWGWVLHSPVSSYIRGKDNHLFRKDELIKQIGINEYPNTKYNEIINGMNYIAKYHNIPFMFMLSPDKESVLLDYLPDWATKFKQRHKTMSLREYLLNDLNHVDFCLVDIYASFIDNPNLYFNKRYDVYHWNANGLELAMNKIVSFALLNNIYLDNIKKYYSKIHMTNKVYPYYFNNSYENIYRLKLNNNFDNITYIKSSFKRKNWTSPDQTLNKNIKQNNLLLLSDSSFKTKFLSVAKNKFHSNSQLTPFIFVFRNYMHVFNKNYISYQYYSDNIKYVIPDIIVYQITERTLDEKGFPNDTVFKILGRYALKKNENFVFPENIVNKTNKEIADIELQVEKNTYFDISKEFKTNINGEIYISFRYLAPQKTIATLEYSLDKDFSNIKNITANIGGGMIQ